MKVLVTGANGFIGRAFCAEAIRRGHEVLGLVRSADRPLPWQAAVGSLENAPWSTIASFQPQALVHLSWIATPGVYLTSPENAALVTQSQAFLKRLAQEGVKRVVAAGTCIEYAASGDPLHESTSALHATYPYSQAKAKLREWLEAEGGSLGFVAAWARIFYPYGPGEHQGRLPTLLMRRLANGESVELRTPDSIKDYIYIDDLAASLCSIMESSVTGSVNVGSGHGVRISDLALTMAEIVGADASVVRHAEGVTVDPWPVQIADISRLESIASRPATSLHEGLTRLARSLGY